MRSKQTNVIEQTDVVKVLVGTGLILAIPFVAMQFNTGVQWGVFDFTIIGLLLFITGFLLTLAGRTAGKYKYLAFAGIMLIALFIWAELAVGIIRTPFAGN